MGSLREVEKEVMEIEGPVIEAMACGSPTKNNRERERKRETMSTRSECLKEKVAKRV